MILRILSRPAPLIIAAVVLLVVVLLNFELISLASRPPNAGISHDIPPVVFSSTDTAAKSLLDYVRQPVHGVCNHTKTFGGSSVVGSEGSWTICMDLLPPTTFPCVVYSFGINNDFSFDDQIHLKATDHGCEVHSFDPSMGVQSHERTPGHWFHDAGISAVDSDNWDGGLTSANHDNTKGWVVKTVPSWMNTLSHNKINLLKIDTEYAEWGALQNLLDTGYIRQVDQLVVEVHFWTSRKDKQRTDAQEMAWWMTTLLRLESAGFKLFYKHENPLSSVEGSEGAKYLCCHELGFVRQLPSFKVANRVEHVAADPEPAAKKIQRLVNLIEKPIAKDACASTDVFGGTPRGQGDGVWTICRDLLPKTSTKCIVYSFGINNDFSFDDQIGAGGVDGGCEVHSFDPSMGVDSYQRSSRHLFHNGGIGPVDSDDWNGGELTSANRQNTHGWTVKTVPTWMHLLGHSHISVLKIDTEYAEWDVIQNLFESEYIHKIDQIVLEIHMWTHFRSNPSFTTEAEVAQYWINTLTRLENAGFKKFSVHKNPQSSQHTLDGYTWACCYEIGFQREVPKLSA